MAAKPAKRPRWLRWLVRVLLAVIVLVAAILGVLLVMEWRPDALMETPLSGGGAEPAPAPSELTLLSWNIGYAGLGRDADFFMDGGEQVRPPDMQTVQDNLAFVCGYLKENSADVVLLQEVDSDASRTFGIDQVETVAGFLPAHAWARALNFKVAWVPYPLLTPIGRVESGLVSFSRLRPTRAVRHQLPGDQPWPVRVFHLKRCLHELRLPAPDGKDWVLLHHHLSAFDRGGKLRRQQMAYLKELMLTLHREGHHVVVGGDWNHAPPGVSGYSFDHQAEIPSWWQKVPADWTPAGWTWALDAHTPSLRATNQPYVPGENFITTVDAFLVGPDIEVVSVRTEDQRFTHTDHHPVHLHVRLLVP